MFLFICFWKSVFHAFVVARLNGDCCLAHRDGRPSKVPARERISPAIRLAEMTCRRRRPREVLVARGPPHPVTMRLQLQLLQCGYRGSNHPWFWAAIHRPPRDDRHCSGEAYLHGQPTCKPTCKPASHVCFIFKRTRMKHQGHASGNRFSKSGPTDCLTRFCLGPGFV